MSVQFLSWISLLHRLQLRGTAASWHKDVVVAVDVDPDEEEETVRLVTASTCTPVTSSLSLSLSLSIYLSHTHTLKRAHTCAHTFGCSQ